MKAGQTSEKCCCRRRLLKNLPVDIKTIIGRNYVPGGSVGVGVSACVGQGIAGLWCFGTDTGTGAGIGANTGTINRGSSYQTNNAGEVPAKREALRHASVGGGAQSQSYFPVDI
jgi:hypothetical protein